MTRLTSKDKEILYDLTENLLQHLKLDGAVRITDKHIIIYKSVEDKNPQNIFIALLKEYAVNFDDTIKIHQGGFESALPWCIKVDKSKYANLTEEQVLEKVKEAIRLAILDKCPWVSEIISLDNIKFSQELINNETNQE